MGNKREMINGVIIDGEMYKAVNRGVYHCSDCDLWDKCSSQSILLAQLCLIFRDIENGRIIFKRIDKR